MLRSAAFPVLLLLTGACASVPMAPPHLDSAAKEFKTTPGKANVYLFRDENMGAAVKMTVVLDGRIWGDTAAKTYLLAAVDPGPHSLVSKAENDSRLDFVAEPGTNVFVWQEVRMGLLKARTQLHFIDAASAPARVNACSLALPEPSFAPPPVAPRTASAAVPSA